MTNKFDWNPIYIRTVAADKPKFRVDADYWNALWNSTIEQGDNNTAGILLLKTEVEAIAEMFTAAMDPTTGIIAQAAQQAKLAEGHQIKAEEAVENASMSAQTAIKEARKSQSWAVGGTGIRFNEDNDNAKYYSEQIAITASEVSAAKRELEDVVTAIEEIRVLAFEHQIGAETAKNAAQVAQAAAEKARDEAQEFVGGDFVTSDDFEEFTKDFVTTSDMEAYVDSIMMVDEGMEV